MSHREFLKRFVSPGSKTRRWRERWWRREVVHIGIIRRLEGRREPVPGERKAIDNVAIIDDSTQLDASWLVCARMTTTTVVRNDDAELCRAGSD